MWQAGLPLPSARQTRPWAQPPTHSQSGWQDRLRIAAHADIYKAERKVAEFRKFQQLSREFVDTNVEICRLRPTGSEPPTEQEKTAEAIRGIVSEYKGVLGRLGVLNKKHFPLNIVKGCGRVGHRRVALSHISCAPSSNWTCGFPASSSPTIFFLAACAAIRADGSPSLPFDTADTVSTGTDSSSVSAPTANCIGVLRRTQNCSSLCTPQSIW
jgi:hypothetical protein